MEATTTARNVKKDSRWVMPYLIDACYQTHCQAFKQGLTQAFVQCQACWSFFSNECFQHHKLLCTSQAKWLRIKTVSPKPRSDVLVATKSTMAKMKSDNTNVVMSIVLPAMSTPK